MDRWITRLVCVGLLVSCSPVRAEDVDVFLENLSIPDGTSSTNVYSWTLPATLSVSGLVYRVYNPLGQEERTFSLVTDGYMHVARCNIGQARDAEEAVRKLGEVMVFCVQMHMVSYAASFRPFRDGSGNVHIVERGAGDAVGDVTRCHRTFGNLYLDIRTNTNTAPVSAQAVADALLSSAVRVGGGFRPNALNEGE